MRVEFESYFKDIPLVPRLLAYALITRANLTAGTVENITYRDLAVLLTVSQASGRKDAGTPQKQTIRSYLRTIETQCGEHFKIISDGQSLKFHFPTLPAIYASHFKREEVYTPLSMGKYTPETLINTDQDASNDDEVGTEEYTEEYTDLYTPEGEQALNACEHACAKIKTTKPNNNNSKQILDELPGEIKKPIPDDFKPSQAMIDNAMVLGLPKVTDSSELNKFIIFNKSSGSRWANWDYVFLNWLMRDAEREQAKKASEQKQANHNPETKQAYSRSIANERLNPRQTATERVIAAISEGSQLEFCQQTRRFNLRGTPAPKPAPVRYLDCHDLGPVN